MIKKIKDCGEKDLMAYCNMRHEKIRVFYACTDDYVDLDGSVCPLSETMLCPKISGPDMEVEIEVDASFFDKC